VRLVFDQIYSIFPYYLPTKNTICKKLIEYIQNLVSEKLNLEISISNYNSAHGQLIYINCENSEINIPKIYYLINDLRTPIIKNKPIYNDIVDVDIYREAISGSHLDILYLGLWKENKNYILIE